MIELKKAASSVNNRAKKPHQFQGQISSRKIKGQNVLGIGLLQPQTQKFRDMHEPVFTENNSLIEDLSQQKTNVRDEDYNNFVSWNSLEKMQEIQVEETPDDRRHRKKMLMESNKKGTGYLTD